MNLTPEQSQHLSAAALALPLIIVGLLAVVALLATGRSLGRAESHNRQLEEKWQRNEAVTNSQMRQAHGYWASALLWLLMAVVLLGVLSLNLPVESLPRD